jgi:hypothetical protein
MASRPRFHAIEGAPQPISERNSRRLIARRLGRPGVALADLHGSRPADEYAKIIASDGATVYTKHGLKDHPLLKQELAALSFVVRSLHRLGLDIEPRRK